jgi:hypothetical protein
MTDKKSIVIKVKYPVQGRQPEKALSAPQMITEWNVKRIALALGAMILAIALPLYSYFSRDSHQPPVMPDKVAGPEINRGAAADSKKDTEAKAVSHDNIADAEPKQQLPIIKSEVNKEVAEPVKSKLEENTGKEKSGIKVNETAKKPPVILEKKNIIKEHASNKVVKSQLSYKIFNKTPVDIIKSTVRVSKTKAVWVNYFTELKGMNNRTIYHEWIKKGKVVTRQRLNISAGRWRTASSKLFNHTAEGHWHVRAVDEKGRLLDQKEFNIVLDR